MEKLTNRGQNVDIFEGLFKTKQAGRSLQDYYGSLRSLLTQLEVHQPYTTDIATQRRYREELVVALFLADLDSPVSSQIRGPILSAQSLPTLGETFSTALRVSTGIVSPAAPLSSTESTALLSSGPRSRNRGSDGGRGRGRDGQGRGRGRDGQLYPPCEHCQRYGHRSDRCWEKFGKPAQMAHAITTTNTSSIAPDSLLISRAEYDRLMTTHTPAGGSPSGGSLTSHLASTLTSGTALLASPPGPWIIDSGASAHMSGTPSLLSRLSRLPNPESVSIADGRVCPVAGKGLATPTSSLPLSDVLYVPNFPVNLLSISAITKTLFCSVYFFPYHCTFQDLRTGKRIGLGRETGRGLYELVPDTPSTGLVWARMYGYQSNIGRTVDIFEGLFKTKQAGRSLQDYYGSLRSLLTQLEVHQPYTTDIATQRRYREELAVVLFLAGLDSPVSSQIRGPILSAQSLPTLGETFSTALRVSTGIVSPAAPLSSTESTALLSSGPRSRNRGSDGGRGRGRDGQGRGRGRDGQRCRNELHRLIPNGP